MIPVLFVQPKGVYKKINGIDPWDHSRGALNFQGSGPVVCHPPCRAWSRMRKFARPDPGERELAIWAVNLVRKNGGVLEHPASSELFSFMRLPLDGSYDEFGGFVVSVDQCWFGHRARKKTWLYIVGCKRSDLPAHPLSFDVVQFKCGGSTRRKGKPHLREIGPTERSATPVAFANWLIAIARICNQEIKLV